MSAKKAHDGKHIVVTGATGALGVAVVAKLLRGGATCHVTYSRESSRDRLPNSNEVHAHRVDVRSEPEVTAFYQSLERVDASVHVVGGFSMGPFIETSLEQFESLMNLNVASCFLCCREAVKRMVPNGNGRIVNVGSRSGVEASAGALAYGTSKAAVAALTRNLAEEVKDQGILVNAVLPSIMDTPGNRKAMPNADFENWPKVEQVAQVIAYLCSFENVLTTGALVPAYGRV